MEEHASSDEQNSSEDEEDTGSTHFDTASASMNTILRNLIEMRVPPILSHFLLKSQNTRDPSPSPSESKERSSRRDRRDTYRKYAHHKKKMAQKEAEQAKEMSKKRRLVQDFDGPGGSSLRQLISRKLREAGHGEQFTTAVIGVLGVYFSGACFNTQVEVPEDSTSINSSDNRAKNASKTAIHTKDKAVSLKSVVQSKKIPLQSLIKATTSHVRKPSSPQATSKGSTIRPLTSIETTVTHVSNSVSPQCVVKSKNTKTVSPYTSGKNITRNTSKSVSPQYASQTKIISKAIEQPSIPNTAIPVPDALCPHPAVQTRDISNTNAQLSVEAKTNHIPKTAPLQLSVSQTTNVSKKPQSSIKTKPTCISEEARQQSEVLTTSMNIPITTSSNSISDNIQTLKRNKTNEKEKIKPYTRSSLPSNSLTTSSLNAVNPQFPIKTTAVHISQTASSPSAVHKPANVLETQIPLSLSGKDEKSKPNKTHKSNQSVLAQTSLPSNYLSTPQTDDVTSRSSIQTTIVHVLHSDCLQSPIQTTTANLSQSDCPHSSIQTTTARVPLPDCPQSAIQTSMRYVLEASSSAFLTSIDAMETGSPPPSSVNDTKSKISHKTKQSINDEQSSFPANSAPISSPHGKATTSFACNLSNIKGKSPNSPKDKANEVGYGNTGSITNDTLQTGHSSNSFTVSVKSDTMKRLNSAYDTELIELNKSIARIAQLKALKKSLEEKSREIRDWQRCRTSESTTKKKKGKKK